MTTAEHDADERRGEDEPEVRRLVLPDDVQARRRRAGARGRRGAAQIAPAHASSLPPGDVTEHCLQLGDVLGPVEGVCRVGRQRVLASTCPRAARTRPGRSRRRRSSRPSPRPSRARRSRRSRRADDALVLRAAFEAHDPGEVGLLRPELGPGRAARRPGTGRPRPRPARAPTGVEPEVPLADRLGDHAGVVAEPVHRRRAGADAVLAQARRALRRVPGEVDPRRAGRSPRTASARGSVPGRPSARRVRGGRGAASEAGRGDHVVDLELEIARAASCRSTMHPESVCAALDPLDRQVERERPAAEARVLERLQVADANRGQRDHRRSARAAARRG